MTDRNPWDISGRRAAQLQIREAVLFLCEGKSQAEREEIGKELVGIIREIAEGDRPAPRTDPLDSEEHAREGWTRMVANYVVSGALAASERSPSSDSPPPNSSTRYLRSVLSHSIRGRPLRSRQ
jgi:hypothetical protein